MISRRFVARTLAWMLCGSVCMTVGCVGTRPGGSLETAGPPTARDEESARNLLESTLNAVIRTANERHENGETEVRNAPPYYYSLSEYFPEGPGQFRVGVRRVAGNRSRFEATVAVACHRDMTRYHLSRTAAARDKDLIREEGVMHIVYTLSGAEWVQKYSYFEPVKVKQFDGTQWNEVPFVADRFIEDQPSFWRRLFGRIF